MKAWGGRFTANTAAIMEAFNNSISFDWELYAQDIQGSKVHATMLGKIGVLTEVEVDQLHQALDDLLVSFQEGNLHLTQDHEDIHMNIEALLVQKLGPLGKKLHTARSRNDQVAYDFKSYVKNQVEGHLNQLEGFLKVIIRVSEVHMDYILPGVTHLQPAQPVRLSFHLMAYGQMVKRDMERMADLLKRMDECPLGAGALAGTSYPTDRWYTAQALGYAQPTANAMDSVSDRDFAIEYLSVASMIFMHLSRLAEEVILWSSGPYGFMELDDRYATGSSIMPQKKNPDAAELIRGKTGTVYGRLMGFLSMMKALPMAYNKDMQEDKVPVFQTAKDLTLSIKIFSAMLETATFNKENMARAAIYGYINATDAADYLVEKGLPFRDAHKVVGQLVQLAIQTRRGLTDLTLEEYQLHCMLFQADVFQRLDLETCIEAKQSYGSTARKQVTHSITIMKEWLKSRRKE